MLIYTIGLGSPAGAPIPMYSASGRQTDFKRDKMGNVVVSKLDEAALEKIATIGNGKYFRGTTGAGRAGGDLQERQRAAEAGVRRRSSSPTTRTGSSGSWLPALLLSAGELLLSETPESAWLARWNLLRKEGEKAA